MPAFVVQQHDQPHTTHWDFMLEQPDSDRLATWQIPLAPEQWSTHPLDCTRIFDHRRKYLTYAGPLSDDRGHVHPVDHGSCELLESNPDLCLLRLHGQTLCGTLLLMRKIDAFWQLTFTGDSQ